MKTSTVVSAVDDNWSLEGWLVRVNWQPLLPERHSPISTSTGRG